MHKVRIGTLGAIAAILIQIHVNLVISNVHSAKKVLKIAVLIKLDEIAANS